VQVGAFNVKGNATKLAKKLNTKGFQLETKIVEPKGKVYMVGTGNLTTEKKAQQTKKNLIDFGFKNSFIRN